MQYWYNVGALALELLLVSTPLVHFWYEIMYPKMCNYALIDLGNVNLRSTPLSFRKSYMRNNSLLLWGMGPGGQEEDTWVRFGFDNWYNVRNVGTLVMESV